MAKFQRILECESFVTGFFVALAIYCIHKAYIAVYWSEQTNKAMKNLTVILEDFDQRYHQADQTGKVIYTGNLDIG